jgi:hypothetical protein
MPPPNQGFWKRIANKAAQFFSSQAKLSLIVLMIFSGLIVGLAPIAFGYVMHSKTMGKLPTPSTRGGSSETNQPARCNQILVTFAKTATISQISTLLEQLDSSIAFGPNENGSFELLVPSVKAIDILAALNRADDLVIVASKRERCL